jgi:plasmid stability protein
VLAVTERNAYIVVKKGSTVATLTIRNIEDDLKRRLRIRAARHGRSMEEELRVILRAALAKSDTPSESLYDAIRAHFGPLGGVDLELPPRDPPRDPPRFEA